MDSPRYPVAWSVDARVPDEVRALIRLILENYREDDDGFIVSTALNISSMLDNPPPGKHAIPTD